MFKIINLFKKNKENKTDIYLYNTLSKNKEIFKSIKKGQVLFYQCGPTVYWTQHIGNLRATVIADVIVRTFLYNDFKVKFARNYTDVGHLVSDGDVGEDKMEKGSKREGLSPAEIADKYISIYENDIKELNNLEPDFKPRATDYIKEMQALVETLLEKGFAYSTDLAIYFDISKVTDYNKLSKQVLEDNISGAGSGEIQDPQKRDSADFALWFFRAGTHKNALQYWPSPFTSPLVENGNGFPGWHIECSAMSKKLLGETLDIHMGGIEHIPVHHTNEIAQSESANGTSLAHYWLHNEHLLVNNGKMSKSEGTAFSLAEIKEKGFSPLALRYFYLQAQYRSKQNFSWEAMQSSQTGYDRLLKNIVDLGEVSGKINTVFQEKFRQAINNDFNTPQALSLVFDLLKTDLSNEDKLATVLDFDKVLGLDFKKIINDTGIKINIPDEINEMVKKREHARQGGNWTKSDELRDKIFKLGYEVKDTDRGPKITRK
jgi:cysteinyl-tRNA synthetase